MESPPEVSSAWLQVVVGWLLGFLSAVFAEPARRFFFKPKLCLRFSRDKWHVSDTAEYNQKTGEKIGGAQYIRVAVTNRSKHIARDCRAYLVDVEKEGPNGGFVATEYCDSIPLAWSCQEAVDRFRGLDMPKGVVQYVDVIVTREHSDQLYPQLLVKPARYSALFKQPGVFRFTMQLSAEGADPQRIALVMRWNGVWNEFSVRTSR